jgi:ADP-ribose pyrophosphatase YjhB (NUDIX family)
MINNYDNEDKLIVAVDCIIFGFDNEELKILLVKRGFEPEKGKWSLMGGFLKKNETLDDSANRVLFTLTGLHNVYMEQLQAFSEIDRDPANRTISIAYSALINTNDHNEELSKQYSAKWFPINKIPDVIFDHTAMIERAMRRLRYKASVQPIGFELLPEKFTMRQLQKLYEAIFNEEIDKRNFSKKILALNLLTKLKEKDMESSKKGSFLYKFDRENYLNKLSEGIPYKV